MKSSFPFPKEPWPRKANHRAAFTLVEVMLSITLLVMVLGGVMTSHLMGLRLFELAESKLGATDDARKAASLISTEVRAAKLVKVGNGNEDGFTEVAMDTPQQGNALQLYPTTDLTQFIRYYVDSRDDTLRRMTNGGCQQSIVARSITNNLVFTAEDWRGTVLTNNRNNRVIGLRMEFYQIQYPVYRIGPGNYYDSYQLRTRITRRALE
jgi:Tfp pilus assembly protein PilW